MTTIPTLGSLSSTIKSNIQSALGIVLSIIFPLFLAALPTVLAAQFWLLYIFIGQVQTNLSTYYCDYATLLRRGQEILGRLPFPATAGVYVVSVTGTAGSIISGNQVFISSVTSASPNQTFIITGGAYVMTGLGDAITITAQQAGLIGTLNVGDTLTPVSPILGVNNLVTVGIIDTVAADGETEAEYRQKVIEKIQTQAGSWSAADYRLVGTEVAGVQQTYAYATSGAPAQVTVYLQGEVPGTPISATIISNYIAALAPVQPLGVWFANCIASTIVNMDVTITAAPFAALTSAQQTLVTAALTAFINTVTPFIAAADNTATRNDVISAFGSNGLATTIGNAIPGVGFGDVTFTVSSVSQDYWQADNGQIPYLTSVTYA